MRTEIETEISEEGFNTKISVWFGMGMNEVPCWFRLVVIEKDEKFVNFSLPCVPVEVDCTTDQGGAIAMALIHQRADFLKLAQNFL